MIQKIHIRKQDKKIYLYFHFNQLMTFTKVFKSPLIEYKIKWSRTTKINSFPAPILLIYDCNFQPLLIVFYFNSALMAHYSKFQYKK